MALAGAAALATSGMRAAGAAPHQAVLELFTYQGCSSCPPADALLGELIRRPGVIGLAWHVDYWDRAGWRDPFSSGTATARQRSYASVLGDDVYTPALVVNGAAMMVGSDVGRITAALASPAAFPVAVSLRPEADGLTAAIGSRAEAVTLLLAFFDAKRETQVGAGENDGRVLREFNIVRSSQRFALPPGEARDVALRAAPASMGTALLVQDARLRVLGAAMLPPAAAPATRA